jgi:hypothetical protein
MEARQKTFPQPQAQLNPFRRSGGFRSAAIPTQAKTRLEWATPLFVQEKVRLEGRLSLGG